MADEKETIILELEFDTKAASAQSTKLKKNIVANTKALGDLNKEVRKNGKATTLQAQELNRLEGTLKKDKTAFNNLQKATVAADKANKASTNTIVGLRSRLSGLTAELNNTKIGSERFRELQKETRKTSDELKKLEASVGDNRREVGNYSLSLKKGIGQLKAFAFSAFGLIAIIGGITKAISSAIRITREFSKEISTLKSITGSTTEEMVFFKEAALEIGEATKTSSIEVLKAFTLIGSAQPELLKNKDALADVTEQALILAKAAGIDTVAAAKALTGAMNQFGASAKDAAKFTDIFATSQQKGSSFINDTALALENSGSAADAAGLSFETTNAAIQALAKGSITGARAGTALRGVLSKLSSQTDNSINPSMVGLSATIEELASRNLTLSEATKLVGEEGAVGLLTLVKQRDIFNELDGSLNEVGNAMEQMAINTDNLDGELEELNNQWEEFVLRASEGDGVLTTFTKTASGALRVVNQLVNGQKELSDQTPLTAEEQEEYNQKLIESIEANGKTVESTLLLALEHKVLEARLRAVTEAGKELSEQTLEGADAVSFAVQKWREAKIAVKELKEEQEKSDVVEKERVLTIGELKGEITNLNNAQDKLIPGSKELAANQAEILRIEKLLGKENKDKQKREEDAQREAKKASALALKLTKELSDSTIALIEDEQTRREQIELATFERNKARILVTFGATEERKKLIENLEKIHVANLAKINDEAAEVQRVKQAESDLAALELRILRNQDDLQAKIDQENALREVELENTELTAIEKELIIAQSEKTIEAIRDKARQDQFKKDVDSINELKAINQTFSSFVGSLKDFELALAGDNAEARKKIEKNFADVEAAITIAQIAAATALAITKALPNPLAVVAVTATGAVQAATAIAQRNKIKNLGEGGEATKSGVFNGPSHASPSKGIDYFGTDGNHVRVEGGELWAVMNKKSTAMIKAFSGWNALGGGVDFAHAAKGGAFMQDGGVVQRFVNQPVISQANQSEDILNAVRNLPPSIVIVEDINTGQANVAQVIERSQI